MRRHIVGGPAGRGRRAAEAWRAEDATAWCRRSAGRVRASTAASRTSSRGRPRSPTRYRLEVDSPAPDGDGSSSGRASASASGASRSAGVDLLINGARVFIRGVNRHDFDQRTGRVVSPDVDAGRPRRDEALRLQRGAHLALPERPGVPRPDRRARAVRDRRGGHRVARLPGMAVRRPALPRAVGRARVADGAPRPEPPLDHRLVARQRVGPRREPRCRGGLGAAASTHRGPLHYEGADPLGLDERPARSPTSPARCTRSSTRSSSTRAPASSGTP